jgi:hypothetical protein
MRIHSKWEPLSTKDSVKPFPIAIEEQTDNKDAELIFILNKQ